MVDKLSTFDDTEDKISGGNFPPAKKEKHQYKELNFCYFKTCFVVCLLFIRTINYFTLKEDVPRKVHCNADYFDSQEAVKSYFSNSTPVTRTKYLTPKMA